MPRAYIATAVVLVPLLSACQRTEDRTITKRVSPPELVGTWRLTEEGLKGLRFGGHTANLSADLHRIELRADSTCTYTTVVEPCLQANPSKSFLVAADAPCSWRLHTNGRYQEVSFDLTPEPGHPTHLGFNVTEEGGRLLLFTYVCDPDQWRYLEFSR